MEDESATTTSKFLNSASTSVRAFEKTVIDEGLEIRKKLSLLFGQIDYLGLKQGVQRKTLQRLPAPLVVKESDVYGRDEDKEKIVKLLLSDDASGQSLSVIPIVGLGGVGKTTLAQLVYKDSSVREHFDLMAWVTVSEEFDVFKITKIIFEKVTSRECKIRDLFQLQSELSEALAGKKFLLVHDDVWNEYYQLWDVLKSAFESGAHGSKIIVTTRSKIVASTMGNVAMHELKLLSDEDCWQIFAKHVFNNNTNSHALPELQEIGLEIVKRCKGLPLAVKSLAGLLRCTSKPDEWRKIVNSDIWHLQFQQNLKNNVVPALWLSYQFLPRCLKRCFAYCSIFPKDYEFVESDMKKIVWLWMAEGLLQAEEGKKIEEVGEEYLQALIVRSFFQYSSQDESMLIMHDIVHDLAMFIAGEFSFELGDSNDLHDVPIRARHLSYRKESEVSTKMKELTSQTNSLRILLALPLSDAIVWPQPILEKSLLNELFLKVGGCLKALSLSESSVTELPDSIGNMKSLRYLDLSDTGVKEIPDSICTLYNLQTLLLSGNDELAQLPIRIAALVNLRHLDIRGTALKEIPDSICTLYNLQTLLLSSNSRIAQLPIRIDALVNLRHLDIRGTSLKEIPDSICTLYNLQTLLLSYNLYVAQLPIRIAALVNLRHLDISGTRLKEMPPLMCKMKNLQTLSDFVLGENGGSRIKELGDLPLLEGSLCISGLENIVDVRDVLEANLKDKKFLSRLILRWNGDCDSNDSQKQREVLEALRPHTNLKKLRVEGYRGTTFPDWVGDVSFCNMVEVQLADCNCCMLALFGQLPSLRRLEIRGLDGVVSIGNEFCGSSPTTTQQPFRSLEQFTFWIMKWWKQWSFSSDRVGQEGGVFPRLKRLYLNVCQKIIVGLPDWAGDVSFCNMVEVELVDCKNCCMLPPFGQLPSLRRLEIRGLDGIVSIGNEFCGSSSTTTQQPFRSLEVLRVLGMKSWKEWSFGSDRLGQEGGVFPCLKRFDLKYSRKVIVGLPDCYLPSLKLISIWGCDEMVGVCVCPSTQQMITNPFPSLHSITVRNCPNLESLFGMSHFNHLSINDCKKLWQNRMNWDLQSLSSLKSLRLGGVSEVDSFPEEGILPTTLTSLSIHTSRNLKGLNGRAFQHLTSLQRLEISSCENLECFPEEGLPLSLSYLEIQYCPLLKQRCQRGTGEDWHIIQHIPKIIIDGRPI